MRCRSLRAAGPSRETPIRDPALERENRRLPARNGGRLSAPRSGPRALPRGQPRAKGTSVRILIDGQKRFAAVEQNSEDGPAAGQRIDDRLPGDLVGQAAGIVLGPKVVAIVAGQIAETDELEDQHTERARSARSTLPGSRLPRVGPESIPSFAGDRRAAIVRAHGLRNRLTRTHRETLGPGPLLRP